MRRAMLVVMLSAVGVTGCAPIYGAAPLRGHIRPPAVGPSFDAGAVVGRWDNVMLLPRGARIRVLLMDGSRAEGMVTSVTATALTLDVASGAVDFASDEIGRIDRAGNPDRVKRGLSGAVHGAGAMALVGLIAGHAPPPRVFAAAGIAGADIALHSPIGSGTVYISPQLRR